MTHVIPGLVGLCVIMYFVAAHLRKKIRHLETVNEVLKREMEATGTRAVLQERIKSYEELKAEYDRLKSGGNTSGETGGGLFGPPPKL